MCQVRKFLGAVVELDFRNTKIAFAHLTNADLKKAKRLFSLMNQSKLVTFGSKALLKALDWGLPLDKALRSTLFERFCGGENIDEALELADKLLERGIRTSLHYAVEAQANNKGFDQTAEKTIETIIRQAGVEELPSLSVIKLSGLVLPQLLEKSREHHTPSEKLQFKAFLQRLERICSAANNHGGLIFIDAEESWLQVAIDEIALDMMNLFNKKRAVVYTTVQMYRKDGLFKLKNLNEEAQSHHFYAGIKLVRGAYLEKETQRALATGIPSPLHTTKAATDEAYDEALRYVFEHMDRLRLFAGSHNESSIALFANLCTTHNLDRRSPLAIAAQLYGMGDHITYQLASKGLHACKYIPFGPLAKVVPYLIRRAQENSSVQGETSRELNLIVQEIERRACQ